MRKLKFGFFSFTGDEGCMMVFLESLNYRLKRWKDRVEFQYSKILREKNELKGLDFAFVEGAISTKDEVERIKEVRKSCKKLVAIGACAIDASPSAHRNFFAAKERKEITPILKRFGYLDKVYPLSKFVKVDHTIQGCPMDEEKFVEFVDSIVSKVK
jgi:NAD-reducing hydrogenase small subunit